MVAHMELLEPRATPVSMEALELDQSERVPPPLGQLA